MTEQTLTYEAAVYSKTVKYVNYKGETKEEELFFALDPLQLLQVIAKFGNRKAKKSNNPAKQNEIEALSDEEQVKFVRDLLVQAAGFPSEDGESWEPFEDFENTMAGKAMITKLVSSDGDRRDFSEKVVLDPFRSFVNFAVADQSNTQVEVQQFQKMLKDMEKLFATPNPENETLDERRARLEAELAEFNRPAEGTQGDDS